jgi:OPT family oligopeptide transporter
MIAGYVVSPLTVPWHSLANTCESPWFAKVMRMCLTQTVIGLVIFIWIVTPAIHYSNTWYSQYIPISDANSYDNMLQQYDVTKILNDDYTLNLQKYKEYSPIFLSTTFILQYGLSFAATTALITHTALYHGRDLWKRLRHSSEMPKDIHQRIYEKYPIVPLWWYLILFVIMIVIGFITMLHWPTQLPWWGYILAIAIAGFFLVCEKRFYKRRF